MKYYRLEEVRKELERIIKGETLGYNIILDESNDLYYKWNPGNLSGSSVTVSPTTSTTYTVTGTNVN